VIKDVVLHRVLTAEVADMRKMFDLFTSIENRANKKNDQETLQEAEQALALWTDMLTEEKDESCWVGFEEVQGDCDAWLEELIMILEKIDLRNWVSDRDRASQEAGVKQHLTVVPESGTCAKSASLRADMELEELIQFFEGVCAEMKNNISANILAVPRRVGSKALKNNYRNVVARLGD